jgi:Flp pilus assembly protein TadG
LNKRGNVAIICALTALPLISAVGCAIDYSIASLIKTKLQAAADAATLATVSVNSPAMATAKLMTGSGTVTGGSTDATNYFGANLSTAPASTGYTGLTSSATVTKSSQVVTAKMTFSASVPTYFMGIVGYKTMSVSGSSSASSTLPTYINFYLMLDVSGSMSFPSTTAEQQRLLAVNPTTSANIPTAASLLAISARKALAPSRIRGRSRQRATVIVATYRTHRRADTAKVSPSLAWEQRPPPSPAEPIQPTAAM